MGPQGAVPEWGRQIGVSKWSDGQMPFCGEFTGHRWISLTTVWLKTKVGIQNLATKFGVFFVIYVMI